MSDVEQKCKEASKAVAELLGGREIPCEIGSAWNRYNCRLIDLLHSKDARIAELEGALNAHHRWHLDCDEPDSYAVPDGNGGWLGLNRAEEYSQSYLYDLTILALSKPGPNSPDEPVEHDRSSFPQEGA